MMYDIPCTAEIGWMDESLCSNSSKSGSIIHFYAILIQMIQCRICANIYKNKHGGLVRHWQGRHSKLQNQGTGSQPCFCFIGNVIS